MKAFVTGATGFIGTHLIKFLDAEGWEIIALHRPSSDLSELKKCKKVSYAVGDIMDIESMRKGMPAGVDAVFHVAGSVGHLPHSQEKSRYAVNQDGTRNVVDVCLEKKAKRIIYTSTVLTYDFHTEKGFNESAPPNLWCRDPYIHSKRLAEDEMEKGIAAGLDAVILHPSAVFGSYDKATWSKMFLEIQRGLPLPVAPPGGGSVCNANNVAQAHVAAFHKGKKGAHYILGGPDVTWLQVAQDIAGILGKPKAKIALPTPIFKLYGWCEFGISSFLKRDPTLTPHAIDILSEYVYSDSSKAISELGYKPSTLDQMLNDCYRWMLNVGMLPPKTTAAKV